MSEYTPKTHEIRAAAVNHRAPLIHRQMFGQTIRGAERVALAEFDRWLAEVQRAAAEKAWDECLSQMPFDLDWKNQYGDQNPYRRNEGEN